jgi:thiosulfate/3-mercaptopyruvate sulfurtransferase
VIYRTVVSTSDLADHLDTTWVIVDCRYDLQREDWGTQQYIGGHIPGAVYISLSQELAGTATGTNGRHPLPPSGHMAALFGRLGIASGVQVVAYDQDLGMYASRLWWMLRYAGHDAVAVLDGGFARWVREGRPVRAGEESRPAVRFEAAWRSDLLATLDDVVSTVESGDRLLLDARSPERFSGQSEPIDRAAGHIPGAVNHPYRRNAGDEGTFLPPEQLRRQFSESLSGRTPRDVVMYCGSGVTACHNLLAMEHAGLPGARLYPGSWSEWSADQTRAVETGSGQRDAE